MKFKFKSFMLFYSILSFVSNFIMFGVWELSHSGISFWEETMHIYTEMSRQTFLIHLIVVNIMMIIASLVENVEFDK